MGGRARCHLYHAAGGALLAAALLLASAVPGARAQGETVKFSYDPGAPNGPENWGNLKTEWVKCSTGKMQSPIDLSSARARQDPSLGYLDYLYRPAHGTMVNRGYEIDLNFKNNTAGRLVINDTVYDLKQLHWHTPSEHTIDGRRYDMELHLVHRTPENKTAVIGVLYKLDLLPDLFLKRLEPAIRNVSSTRDQPQPVGVVDPNGARATGSVYYRYMGSLTTPPCTEGVVWTVFKKVRPVAEYQVKLLMDALDEGNKMNARPLQDVNNRDISIFRPYPYIIHI